MVSTLPSHEILRQGEQTRRKHKPNTIVVCSSSSNKCLMREEKRNQESQPRLFCFSPLPPAFALLFMPRPCPACSSQETLSNLFFLCKLSEPRSAATHYFTLADQLGAELGAVQCQVDVEVHPVKCALGRVHALEVLLEVLAGEIGCQGNDFLDAYIANSVSLLRHSVVSSSRA